MAMKDRITQQAPASDAKRAESFRRPSGRASYPRRMSLDLNDAQYRWLRSAAHEHRVSGAGLVRAALEHLMATPDALQSVVAAADATENADVPQ